jgi:hypothetical protein
MKTPYEFIESLDGTKRDKKAAAALSMALHKFQHEIVLRLLERNEIDNPVFVSSAAFAMWLNANQVFEEKEAAR